MRRKTALYLVANSSASKRVFPSHIKPQTAHSSSANDDRATHEEGIRATYRCAEGPPGGKWNLAADTPPSKRVARRAYKRAREELEMLEREARPK